MDPRANLIPLPYVYYAAILLATFETTEHDTTQAITLVGRLGPLHFYSSHKSWGCIPVVFAALPWLAELHLFSGSYKGSEMPHR